VGDGPGGDEVGKGMIPKVKKPRGPIPKTVKIWLEVNNDVGWEFLVCAEHGKWYVWIDHLAPYHFEMSKCSDCIKMGNEWKMRTEDF